MFFLIYTFLVSLTLSPALPLKVSPPVFPERREQKLPPANSRPVRSQAPQDPVPPTHTTRQPKSHSLASGSQTQARALQFNGPAIPQLKNSKNTPAPAPAPPQSVVSCSVASSAITKGDTEAGPTREASSSSTSGASPRKNGKGKKKVRRVHHLACIDVLTKYRRIRFRRRRTQQLNQLLHRKVYRQSKILSKDLLLCNATR